MRVNIKTIRHETTEEAKHRADNQRDAKKKVVDQSHREQKDQRDETKIWNVKKQRETREKKKTGEAKHGTDMHLGCKTKRKGKKTKKKTSVMKMKQMARENL